MDDKTQLEGEQYSHINEVMYEISTNTLNDRTHYALWGK
jgi:hypothetical protein